MNFVDTLEWLRRNLSAEPNPQVKVIEHPQGHGSLALVRDGYKLQDLQAAQVARRRHSFDDIRSFADWLNRRCPDTADRVRAEILATAPDKDGGHRISAVLNPEDQHSDSGVCLLTYHPLFQSWLGIFGKRLSQQEFHAHVRGVIASFAQQQPVSFGNWLATELQKLKAITGRDLQVDLDQRGFVSFAMMTGTKKIEGEIPPSFALSLPIFMGVFPPSIPRELTDRVEEEQALDYMIEVLLQTDVNDEGRIYFTATAPGLDQVIHQARMDAVAWLRSRLDEGFLVGLGKLGFVSAPQLNPRVVVG